MKQQHGDSSTPEAAAGSAQTVNAARAPITDRVNREPAIMNGMSVSEGKWLAVLCLIGFGCLGGLLWLFTGWWQLMAGVPLFGTGATVWYASLYLAKIKRGRPEGYYQQAIRVWLADRGLAQCRFTRHAGYWSLGRTILGLTSPLVVHGHLPDRSGVTPSTQEGRS